MVKVGELAWLVIVGLEEGESFRSVRIEEVMGDRVVYSTVGGRWGWRADAPISMVLPRQAVRRVRVSGRQILVRREVAV